MRPISWLAIVLIVLGALALGYQGIDCTRQKDVLNVGLVHLTAESHERNSTPYHTGRVGIAWRVVLLVVGARGKS